MPAVPLNNPEMVFVAVSSTRYMMRSPPIVHIPNIPFGKSGVGNLLTSAMYAILAVAVKSCNTVVVVLSVIL